MDFPGIRRTELNVTSLVQAFSPDAIPANKSFRFGRDRGIVNAWDQFVLTAPAASREFDRMTAELSLYEFDLDLNVSGSDLAAVAHACLTGLPDRLTVTVVVRESAYYAAFLNRLTKLGTEAAVRHVLRGSDMPGVIEDVPAEMRAALERAEFTYIARRVDPARLAEVFAAVVEQDLSEIGFLAREQEPEPNVVGATVEFLSQSGAANLRPILGFVSDHGAMFAILPEAFRVSLLTSAGTDVRLGVA